MASPIELKLSRYLDDDTTLNGAEVTLAHIYNPKPGNGDDDVTESIPIFLEGEKSSVISTAGNINRMLAAARKRNEQGYGDRVYLMARAGTADAWYRTPIIDGRLAYTDDGIIAGLSSGQRTNATLSVTRRGWFEDSSESWLALSNANGTITGLNYLNVYNCNDGAGTAPNKRNNYAVAGSAIVTGDLPSPVRLEIKNNGTALSSAYVCASPSQYGAAIPAAYFADCSGSAIATCSGGSATVTSISTDAETTLASIDIQNDNLKKLGGAPFHVIVRFADTTSLNNVKFSMRIINGAGTSVVWSSGWFMFPNPYEVMQDMGVINIPPGNISEWWSGNVRIVGKRITANTETIKIDYMAFFGGAFARIRPVDYSRIKYGDKVIFGGGDRVLTRWDAGYSTAAVKDLYAVGADTLTLYPGVDNVMLFATQGTAADAPIENQIAVRASYRPRRSTL